MQRSTLSLYTASAGSGKTYRLTLTYLSQALQDPTQFQRILAVTFTNKAVGEMRHRIVSYTQQLAEGTAEVHVSTELQATTGLTGEQLQQRAQQLLDHLLYRYSRLAVSTIDTFFTQVVKSFAREQNLSPNFALEQDTDKVKAAVVEDFLSQLSGDKQLLSWCLELAKEKLQRGKSWRLAHNLEELFAQVTSEYYWMARHQAAGPESEDPIATALANRKKLYARHAQVEKQYTAIAEEVAGLLEENALVSADFHGGTNNWNLLAQLGDVGATAGRLGNATMTKALQGVVLKETRPAYSPELVALLVEKLTGAVALLKDYLSLDRLKREYSYQLLVRHMEQAVARYRTENDVLLISDLAPYLAGIIGREELPFVYEKIGTFFQHFLIDEFQDTSRLQWHNFTPLLAEALSQADSHNMVVGDAKQAIYRWRNGDVDLIAHHARARFPELTPHRLEYNYRSHHTVVAFNNTLYTLLGVRFADKWKQLMAEGAPTEFQQMVESFQKIYATASQRQPEKAKPDGLVTVELVDQPEGEKSNSAAWRQVATQRCIAAIEHYQHQGYQATEIAVLVRKNKHAKELVAALAERKAEVQAVTGVSHDVVSPDALLLVASPAVRALVQALHFLNQPDENGVHLAALQQELLNCERKKYEATDLAALVQQAAAANSSGLVGLVMTLSERFGLDTLGGQQGFLYTLADQLATFEEDGGSLADVPQWWDERGQKAKVNLIGGAGQAVQVMTIHKAKGLEFPVVIVPYVGPDADPPSRFWVPTPAELGIGDLGPLQLYFSSALEHTQFAWAYREEVIRQDLDELNALYVATTRASEVLHLIACDAQDKSWGGVLAQTLELPTPGLDAPSLDLPAGRHERSYTYGNLPKRKVTERDEHDLPPPSPKAFGPGTPGVPLRLRERKLPFQQTAADQARQWGDWVHELLAVIREPRQWRTELQRALTLGQYPAEAEEELAAYLQTYFDHPAVQEWYHPSVKHISERDLLLPRGVTLRPDKVLFMPGGGLVVVDYKTGKPLAKHEQQMKGYLQALAEAGHYHLQGALVYLPEVTINQVPW